ncbi:MAG: hypothetical protein DWP97_13790 [Calditrichaeota bacterium]|nr:MAG: hypothetical protein DWP97_13790 [Calditrichota bacterium]
MRKICILTIIFLFAAAELFAGAKVISYQGQLSNPDGTPATDAVYPFEFLLYDQSSAGSILWAESTDLETNNGLFSHNIGSVNDLSTSLFSDNELVYLEVKVDGNSILPRVLLSAAPYAFSAGNLDVRQNGLPSISTQENGVFTIFDTLGEAYIKMQNLPADSAVMLPDSAINADEILDEPGINYSVDINLVTLTTGEMTDLTDFTMTIPDNGYILLYGKCYLLLSGTTGANSAVVQIDETEGGSTAFPYYQIAGLSGYVNSGTNYFPIMVTRVYYKQKGTYTFRLEGKANHSLPAQAQSWDHILTGIYIPTAYSEVQAIVADPTGFSDSEQLNDAQNRGTVYKVDLRELEIKDKLIELLDQ